MPSGKWAPTPVNTEAVREYPARNREWLRRMFAIVVGELPGDSRQRVGSRRNSQLPAGAWGNCGSQIGNERLESNRKPCVSKGTWETQSRRAIARIENRKVLESSPMRQLSGGASVVVRRRESRRHGEGRQDVSCWITEGFLIREGSR